MEDPKCFIQNTFIVGLRGPCFIGHAPCHVFLRQTLHYEVPIRRIDRRGRAGGIICGAVFSDFSAEGTFRLKGSCTVGSNIVKEDDASAVAPTVGVRVGDDFRNRQTNRTFLKAVRLAFRHSSMGRYFYR